MENWIKERINKIENLKDRRALRDAVTGALENLDQYNRQLYELMERRLQNELADFRLEFDIYTAVCAKDDYDAINDFFFPMDPDDLGTPQLDVQTIEKFQTGNQSLCITRLYLECETKKIKELLQKKHQFSGKLRTDSGVSDVKLELRPSRHYHNILADLYHSYMFNDIAWKTVNTAHLEKFVDVILCSPVQAKDGDTLQDVQIDLMDYEPFKLTDRIPLWNVRSLSEKCTYFPMPAYDSINYEHTISTAALGGLDNYIVKYGDDDILYVKRNKEELVVVTHEDRVREWNLFAIHTPRQEPHSWISLPVFTNARTHTFIERYAATLSLQIRSKGELQRLLNSFVDFSDWQLMDVYIGPKENWIWKDSADMNPFLTDHVRVEEEKPVMSLIFQTQQEETYLLTDQMHFFVSEVQLAFPDYACVGRLEC